jgi:beta-glucosidase
VDVKYDLLARGYNEDKLDVSKSKEIENQIKFKLYSKPKEGYEKVLNNPQHQQLALEAALKSIILLKNEQNLLPLNVSKYKTIAVIGPNADVVLLGGYSVENKYCTTLLKGIKEYVDGAATILYNQGCDLIDINKETIAEAVAIAQKADVVILALGQDKIIARENRDRDDLTLTGRQQELAVAIYKTGKPIVLTLQHGQPLAIPWIAEKIPAIVDGWYLGQAAGTAFAKVIFGAYNPGGKLQMTYPRNVGQLPCYYNQLSLGRPRNLFQSDPTPLFPFGHGLSYTTFQLSAPILESNKIAKSLPKTPKRTKRTKTLKISKKM